MNTHTDPLTDVPDSAIADPPPPYPDPQRRHHRSSRSHRPGPSETHLDSEDDDDAETTESTPFLMTIRGHTRHTRQRSFSSTTSGATSFTQTVFSLFRGDEDDETDFDCGGDCADAHGHHHRGVAVDDSHSAASSVRSTTDFFNSAGYKTYFVPLRRRVYYNALFHLLVLNFPYALIAWVYLFVFTVTGTTTLIALPLGAILCFLDLLGARAFSRGELYLQTRFHQLHLPSYQPRPLFTRLRESSIDDYESGRPSCNVGGNITRFRLVKEHSFYKNTYAMFTDPTSYQALFYFLVIKPAITLLITLLLIAFGIPLLIFILPAPIVLRAVRKIGVWQANIAIEGLYRAVR